MTKKQLSAWIKKTWNECQDAAFAEKIPAYWTYMVNGTWRNIDDTEPPDDAYDEGTLESLYTAEQLEAAVLAEREACAKVCEELSNPLGNASLMAEHCAAAIRGRGMDLLTQHSQNIGEYDER